MHRFQFIALMALIQISTSSISRAQDALSEVYGQGVHAYFSGSNDRAIELLTQAIEAGFDDPRVYFFRGLAQARVSGPSSGVADFQQGAELEMAGKRMVNVSRALERVQGAVRIDIEKARQSARISARASQLQVQRARYEQGLKSGAVPALPNRTPGGTIPDDKMDPFADNGGLTLGEKKAMPRENILAPATNVKPEVDGRSPFSTDPAPVPNAPISNPFNAAPTNANPFGSGATAPSTPSANPFGSGATAPSTPSSNPFGPSPSAPSTPSANPFAK